MDRAEFLRSKSPQLIVDLRLYPPEQGGRATTAYPGWGCPCMVSKMQPLVGYDAWPLLGDETLLPSAERRVGLWFAYPEGAETMKEAGHFYLWEGRFIGEATVVVD